MKFAALMLLVLLSGCSKFDRGQHVKHTQTGRTGIVVGSYNDGDVRVSWDDCGCSGYVPDIVLEECKLAEKP